MTSLDLTLPTPAENLALDEVLLESAETGSGGESLRFWESPTPFVVVGYANKIATEVGAEACATLGVPIFRRCSGGGTVVQGPGCLNYTLVLRIADTGPTRNVTSTNRFVMERNRTALASLIGASGADGSVVQVRGHTDLAIGALKFSGNSQRRRKRFLLFHGTMLYAFDLALVDRLLKFPSQQPDYRDGRAHREFITNLNLPAPTVKQALADVWSATEVMRHPPEIPAELLRKYQSAAWNRKF
ncbi:MAG: lipoate--protein ligase family protein [Verrucomicrobiae bacterium]|nr:lipoate--protein ligase family protein [Verrucomicrobiae bacterium]